MVLNRHIFPCLLLVAVAVGVCPGQNLSLKDPLTDGAARVISLSGQVSILKDNAPWALQVGSIVALKQTIISGPDGIAVLQVSDGSTFDVYPNSKVVFRNNPADWKDLLDVFIGQVKVHIQKFNGKPNPNRVRTQTAIISVRGTIFDVTVEDEDATTLVAVEEGQVAVRHLFLPPMQEKLVNPGEYLRVYRNQPLATKQVDRGELIHRILQGAGQALEEIIYRNPGGAGGSKVPVGGGSGGGVPGDTDPNKGGTTAPAPPPPPPPPPPTFQ
jgi:hypothetical protein